jgi:hypothetical protein
MRKGHPVIKQEQTVTDLNLYPGMSVDLWIHEPDQEYGAGNLKVTLTIADDGTLIVAPITGVKVLQHTYYSNQKHTKFVDDYNENHLDGLDEA